MKLSWYRVELDTSGEVVSVCQATQAHDDRLVFYVRSRSEAAATTAARKRFANMGRPPLPPEKRQSKLLSVRFTEAERATLEERAQHSGQSLSNWARSMLLEPIALAPAPPAQPPSTADVLSEVRRAWEEAPNNAAFTRWLHDAMSRRGAA